MEQFFCEICSGVQKIWHGTWTQPDGELEIETQELNKCSPGLYKLKSMKIQVVETCISEELLLVCSGLMIYDKNECLGSIFQAKSTIQKWSSLVWATIPVCPGLENF